MKTSSITQLSEKNFKGTVQSTKVDFVSDFISYELKNIGLLGLQKVVKLILWAFLGGFTRIYQFLLFI
jgi:hypothetical protein